MSKVKVGMIGCGGFAANHASFFSNMKDDVDLVALCDVSEEQLEKFVGRTLSDYEPKPKFYTDIDKMLSEAKPDAVTICTPHTMHFDHCVMALDAGAHVLVEKPMVTSAPDAYALKKKVEETGKILVIGYNTPCTPEYYYIRETIRNKELGNLELVNGYLLQNWMKATTGMWRQEPDLSGGGQAYDSGAHLLNSLCWSVESNVAEVYAFVDNHGTKVDINSSINIRFENGVFAAITVGGNCPSNDGHMMYAFDNGRILTNGWSGGYLDVVKAGQPVKYPTVPGQPQRPAQNFIKAVQGKEEPRTNVGNGIIQSELMDAIYESAKTGQPAKPKR